jgi:hypothetical protein
VRPFSIEENTRGIGVLKDSGAANRTSQIDLKTISPVDANLLIGPSSKHKCRLADGTPGESAGLRVEVVHSFEIKVSS